MLGAWLSGSFHDHSHDPNINLMFFQIKRTSQVTVAMLLL